MTAFAKGDLSPARLRERVNGLPALRAVQEAADGADAYLVGGAVRDLLTAGGRIDLDVAVEASGEKVAELARRIDAGARVYGRFGTARIVVKGTEVDLAATRAETYARPGALPDVREAAIADDLARRDFTVNAMALSLAGDAELLDPHGGLADLRDGVLRVLHERSFVDDPTRALRAARYAARLPLGLDEVTARLIRDTDLGTVSAERIEAELRRLAMEDEAVTALGLLLGWGLVEGDTALAGAALGVCGSAGWGKVADRSSAFLAAGSVRCGAFGPLAGSDGGRALAAVEVGSRPSKLVEAARGRPGVELVIARALGAEWLDDYVRGWRHVRLEIAGNDLLAEGVEEGPSVGRGLAAALAAKIDGEARGRDEELAAALDAARSVR